MTSAETRRLFVACAQRVTAGDDGAPWDDATRDAVHRALADRTDGDAALTSALATARREWHDGATFRAWLGALMVRETWAFGG